MSDHERDVAKLHKAMQRAAEMLMEHCETVQIFCTLSDGPEETSSVVDVGLGNWYARVGQVREWLIMHDERARVQARKDT